MGLKKFLYVNDENNQFVNLINFETLKKENIATECNNFHNCIMNNRNEFYNNAILPDHVLKCMENMNSYCNGTQNHMIKLCDIIMKNKCSINRNTEYDKIEYIFIYVFGCAYNHLMNNFNQSFKQIFELYDLMKEIKSESYLNPNDKWHYLYNNIISNIKNIYSETFDQYTFYIKIVELLLLQKKMQDNNQNIQCESESENDEDDLR